MRNERKRRARPELQEALNLRDTLRSGRETGGQQPRFLLPAPHGFPSLALAAYSGVG